MRVRLLTSFLYISLALGGAAACEHKSTEPDTTTEGPTAESNLTLQPAPTIIYLSHPWAGRQVRFRDFSGDSYDRCLGADALPAANVTVSAQLCYPSGYDALQWFKVIGFSNGTLTQTDATRVSLQSVYDPNYCIDVMWGTANGGERIQLYPCHYGANQQFHIPLPASTTSTTATGSILTKNSSYGMAFEADAPDVRGTVKAIWQRPFSSAINFQKWTAVVR
jgi:hypothetical protein